MNGVATGHFVRGRSGRKEVFLTNGTIGLVLTDFAIVIAVERFVNAHAAIVTMKKMFGSPDAAKAAEIAVIGFLFV